MRHTDRGVSPRRRGGGHKRSGLRDGERRVARTLRFKLQVVDEYRWLQRRKAEGECDAAAAPRPRRRLRAVVRAE